MKGLYILQSTQMLVLIPKRRGKGYLKSCFGWHHTNEVCQYFDDNKPDWFAGDTCDIDLHLAIDLKLYWYEDKELFAQGVKETLEVLNKCFPHITEWECNDDEFWKQIDINLKS